MNIIKIKRYVLLCGYLPGLHVLVFLSQSAFRSQADPVKRARESHLTKKGSKLALKVNQGSKSKQRKEGVGRREGESGGGRLLGRVEAVSRAWPGSSENTVSDVTRLCRMGASQTAPLPLLDQE